MHPEYGRTLRTLTVTPHCSSPDTVEVGYNQGFTGYIPMNQLSYYCDGGDLIHCRIYVHQLEDPLHTVYRYPAMADYAHTGNSTAPKFDLSKIMDGARRNGQMY